MHRTEAAIERVRELFGSDDEPTANGTSELIRSGFNLIAKYNGKRITGSRRPSYERIADKQTSLTDPDVGHG